MKQIFLSLLFLFAFTVCVQGQAGGSALSRKDVVSNSADPSTCIIGKLYINTTSPGKVWARIAGGCVRIDGIGDSYAPATATYIVQTPDATLTAEQALSVLASGLLKNHTGDGVLSIATSGTDYVAPGAVPISASLFCSDAGSTDAYACSLSPTPTLVTGTHYRFKANTANTGAATINFNSLGAVTIKKVAGGITTDLADNDIRSGQWVDLIYDGANMQMQSTLGNAAGGGGLPTGLSYVSPDFKAGTNVTNQAVLSAGSGPGDPIILGAAGSADVAISFASRGDPSYAYQFNPGTSPANLRFDPFMLGTRNVGVGNVPGLTMGRTQGIGWSSGSSWTSSASETVISSLATNTLGIGNAIGDFSGTVKTTTGIFVGPVTVGNGTPILKHLSATATLDFGSLVAIGCEDLTVTVTGATDGDTVALGVPNGSVVANGTYTAWISAADTATVRFCTLATGNPASGTFRVDVWKH